MVKGIRSQWGNKLEDYKDKVSFLFYFTQGKDVKVWSFNKLISFL